MFTRHISRQLAAYIDGELAPRKAPRAERHLGQCGQCRAECEQVRFGMAMVEHLPPAEAPEAIWASIEAALEVSRPVRQWRWALAAALVLALAGVAYWRTAHPSGPRWEVVRLDGSRALIGPGQWIETDSGSRASVKVGEIGSVEVAPNTRVHVVTARPGEHRLALARGEIRARAGPQAGPRNAKSLERRTGMDLVSGEENSPVCV